MAAASVPVFSFGVVADPQYADKDDSWVEGRNQRYREVPGKLEAAVGDWLAHAPTLEFVLNLGDTIDGRNTEDESKEDLEALAKIAEQLGQVPLISVVGNHDLAVPREHYVGSLNCPSSYFSRTVAPGWRLVVLDTTDMSTGSGYPDDSPQMVEARAYLASHPLEKYPNMVDWNGGLSSAQLKWLEHELTSTAAADERVIVACHHPIGRGSARSTHMAWNWQDVQDRLTASKTAVLVLSGHDHVGGYACIDGCHFVTLEAMLEAPHGSNAYGLVHVYHDHIVIKGTGAVTTRKLLLPSRLVNVV